MYSSNLPKSKQIANHQEIHSAQVYIGPNHQTSKNSNLGINESDLRRNFIKKVFGILSLQFLIVVILVICAVASQSYRNYQTQKPGLLIAAFLIEIVLMIAIYCFKSNFRQVPKNYILLFTFTLCNSYCVSFIAGRASPYGVLAATIGTVFITLSLSLYAVFSKKDVSYMIGFFAWLPIAIIFIILFSAAFKPFIVHIIISMIILLLFSFFLVFDIQRLTGRYETQYSYDDYILAALDIYIDVIIIFTELLNLMRHFK